MVLAMAGSLAGTPATPVPPVAATATTPAATGGIKIETAVRTHYENGDPLADFFTALAVRYGVVVIQPDKLDVYVLRSFDLPAKVGDALKIAKETLEPQGYSIIQKISDGRVIVRILPVKEAKRILVTESPLSFGTQGEAVDTLDPTRLVTHVFPIANADQAEALRRTAAKDPDVSANLMEGGSIGASLLLTGPALKVQRTVETLAKLDRAVEGPLVARTVALQHLDAQSTADALNNVFAHDPAPMKAVADRRTNSIVVTGPEDRVVEVMVGLVTQDAKQGRVLPPPRTLPAPPTLPAPGRPGAKGGSQPGERPLGPRGLDEIAARGENGGFIIGESPNEARICSFANKEVIL
jgi:hypothetical protein